MGSLTLNSFNFPFWKITVTLKNVFSGHLFRDSSIAAGQIFMASFWCFYCKLWAYFISFSGVSVVEFEEVNISWEWSGTLTNCCVVCSSTRLHYLALISKCVYRHISTFYKKTPDEQLSSFFSKQSINKWMDSCIINQCNW